MRTLVSYTFLLLISAAILPIFLIVSVLILIFSGFPIIHWSKRVGKDEKIFYMAKFRTMKSNTPQIATHLLEDPLNHVTWLGRFLRKTSLDEIPQIINLLKLDMQIVGPRPALFNQYDLIAKRRIKGINKIKPGITGLAQINGRDNMSIDEKVDYDYAYINNKSFFYDVRIILITIVKIIYIKNIIH